MSFLQAAGRMFGYQAMKTVYLKEFKIKGERPFAFLPKEVVIESAIKFL